VYQPGFAIYITFGIIRSHHPMKLYHYTDSAAIKAVLEYGRLWLSDIRYLNDHNEYKEGEKIIRSVFEAKGAGLPAANVTKIMTHLESYFDSSKASYTFIGSFSRGEDLLSQWRGYCPKAGGYALEFEIDQLKDFGAPLHECIYDDAAKIANAESLFDFAEKVIVHGKGNKSRFFQTTWANIAKFKNSGFSEEREVRAVIFKKQDDTAIRFRTRDSLLIPYIEIEVPYDKLKAVWVGPCQSPELASESLSRFIEHLARDKKHPLASIAKPEVKLSNITFRG
jgi:hypothetical protein